MVVYSPPGTAAVLFPLGRALTELRFEVEHESQSAFPRPSPVVNDSVGGEHG